jgi:hypothetical protein
MGAPGKKCLPASLSGNHLCAAGHTEFVRRGHSRCSCARHRECRMDVAIHGNLARRIGGFSMKPAHWRPRLAPRFVLAAGIALAGCNSPVAVSHWEQSSGATPSGSTPYPVDSPVPAGDGGDFIVFNAGPPPATSLDPSPAPPVQPARSVPPDNTRFGTTVIAERPPPPISGGTLWVTHDGNTTVAADPDRDLVYIVDVASLKVPFAIEFQSGDEPGRIAEDGAGRVHVALRGGRCARDDRSFERDDPRPAGGLPCTAWRCMGRVERPRMGRLCDR